MNGMTDEMKVVFEAVVDPVSRALAILTDQKPPITGSSEDLLGGSAVFFNRIATMIEKGATRKDLENTAVKQVAFVLHWLSLNENGEGESS